MPNLHSNPQLPLAFDVPIFHKTYQVYKNFYHYRINFPKKDHYTLGVKIENSLLDLLELLIAAGHSSKREKLPMLHEASIKLDLTKTFIRLCKDIKVIDEQKYLLLQTDLQEIGKMLGGWIKSLSHKD